MFFAFNIFSCKVLIKETPLKKTTVNKDKLSKHEVDLNINALLSEKIGINKYS